MKHLLHYLTWPTKLAWLTTSEGTTRLPSLVLTHTFSKTQLAKEVAVYGMLFLHISRAPKIQLFIVM